MFLHIPWRYKVVYLREWSAVCRTLSLHFRVGAPGANIGEQARAVLVDTLVDGFLNLDADTWNVQMMHLQHSMSQLNHNILALKAHLGSTDVPVGNKTRCCNSACLSWRL